MVGCDKSMSASPRYLGGASRRTNGATPHHDSPSPWGAVGNLLPTEGEFVLLSPQRGVNTPHIEAAYHAAISSPERGISNCRRQYIENFFRPLRPHHVRAPPHNDGEAIIWRERGEVSRCSRWGWTTATSTARRTCPRDRIWPSSPARARPLRTRRSRRLCRPGGGGR